MNKKHLATIIIALFVSGVRSPVKAQRAVQSNVYFELLGPGGLYSANYEARFGGKPNNFGLKVGISYSQLDFGFDSNSSIVTLPVGINYLFGKHEKYFEVGANITFATATVYNNNGGSTNSGSDVFGTLIFGYRYQPADGGFMFRAGDAPIFGKGFAYGLWPYVSFGYAF